MSSLAALSVTNDEDSAEKHFNAMSILMLHTSQCCSKHNGHCAIYIRHSLSALMFV